MTTPAPCTARRTGGERAVTSYATVESPLGGILIAGDDRGISSVSFELSDRPLRRDPEWSRGGALVERAAAELAAYFAGDLETFDLPLAPRGSSFDQRVWAALRAVPYGEQVSYGDLARRAGRPRAARAVGGACGRNPIAIIIPCHRVIGSTGRLTGYTGGLRFKERLLALERRRGRPVDDGAVPEMSRRPR